MKAIIYFFILIIGCSGPQGSRTNSPKLYSSMTKGQGQPVISSFLDPYNGTDTKKITIPKNFSGKLNFRGKYLDLVGNPLKVRFKFGKSYQPIDIDAAVSKNNNSDSNEDILILDFSKLQFKSIPLFYDLFDYQDYRNFKGDEVFVENTGPLYTTQDSFNENLFCRGLNLEDDPTFEISNNNDECDEIGEKCLYAYAKIADKSLFNQHTATSIIPKYPQLNLKSSDYTKQTFAEYLHKGLPDNEDPDNLKGVLNATEVGNGYDKLTFGEKITFENGETLEYHGPFQAVGYDAGSENNLWEIKEEALIYPGDANNQAFGLFQKSYILSDPNSGYISMMFPRAGKLTLKADTEYFGSEKPFELRKLLKMQEKGTSLFMDGANLRIKNYNQASNEGISSCNVSATIDLISFDPKTGREFSLLLNPIRELKIQLIRPTQKSQEEPNPSKNTGLQEKKNSPPPENKVPKCNTNKDCKMEKFPSCHIVKTGTSVTGTQECALRCYNVPVYGECNKGQCLPPEKPIAPYFNQQNPDCSEAISAPLVLPDGTLRLPPGPTVRPDGTMGEP